MGLCLDSGHFAYAGMSPVAMYRKHAARIPHMHFKNVNGEVLTQLRRKGRGFWDGIKEGVFCPLGWYQGLVDFPALLKAMKANGFSGWVTVEQDADNSIEDVQARLLQPFETFRLNMHYLRSLGVVRPAPAVIAQRAPPTTNIQDKTFRSKSMIPMKVQRQVSFKVGVEEEEERGSSRARRAPPLANHAGSRGGGCAGRGVGVEELSVPVVDDALMGA